jgi:hypothetical protein
LRSALFVRAVLAVAAAFLLSGTLLSAPATSATSDQVMTQVSARAPRCIPKCWAAISFNPETLRSGWTQKLHWGTKKDAMNSALRHCRRRPVNAGHARACVPPSRRDSVAQNGCVAVAWLLRRDRLVQWTVARAYGPKKAQRKARAKLDGRGERYSGYNCSPRRF